MNSNISLYRVCPEEKESEGEGWEGMKREGLEGKGLNRMGRNEKERDWMG